ncbi:hypothetical protein K470DRAFT_270177 [Piedraia hortae CBS 480.64]|uniref:Uncharacterized protein n=1 Tax=Piedraia hortae CBS 480.64 TaxID=1314780 RepID=A0A6A7C0V5_9PEZI|nr:hypothetical protein K470DRAFT_270177 [Piedraia hortae CBS 480.64]
MCNFVHKKKSGYCLQGSISKHSFQQSEDEMAPAAAIKNASEGQIMVGSANGERQFRGIRPEARGLMPRNLPPIVLAEVTVSQVPISAVAKHAIAINFSRNYRRDLTGGVQTTQAHERVKESSVENITDSSAEDEAPSGESDTTFSLKTDSET